MDSTFSLESDSVSDLESESFLLEEISESDLSTLSPSTRKAIDFPASPATLTTLRPVRRLLTDDEPSLVDETTFTTCSTERSAELDSAYALPFSASLILKLSSVISGTMLLTKRCNRFVFLAEMRHTYAIILKLSTKSSCATADTKPHQYACEGIDAISRSGRLQFCRYLVCHSAQSN